MEEKPKRPNRLLAGLGAIWSSTAFTIVLIVAMIISIVQQIIALWSG